MSEIADTVKHECADTVKHECADTVKHESADTVKHESADTVKHTKILRQLEYYFGDINLPRDKFMQEQLKLDDGWFTLETMLKFKRLKSIADTAENIVVALKAVKSEFIELNEDATKVRRMPTQPVPESFRDAVQKHKDSAIYAKGFPDDVTLDEVQTYLEQFGPTLHIQLRKDVNTKKFKGSVYATYEHRADAEAFLTCTDDKVKFRDTADLAERIWRDAHFARKKEASKQQKQENAQRRAEVDAKRQEQKAAADKERLLSRIVRGSLLRLDGVAEPPDRAGLTALFQELRASLGDTFGKENYLDFYEKVLYARFKEENSAAAAWARICEAKGGSVKFREAELLGSVLSGEEEERVWGLVMQARQQHHNERGGGGGGRGGGGRGRGRGGRGGRGGGRFHRGGGGGGGRGGGGGGGPPSKRARVTGAGDE